MGCLRRPRPMIVVDVESPVSACRGGVHVQREGTWRACHRVRGCEPGLDRGRRRKGARAQSQFGGYPPDSAREARRARESTSGLLQLRSRRATSRGADHDSGQLWLSRRETRTAGARRWTQLLSPTSNLALRATKPRAASAWGRAVAGSNPVSPDRNPGWVARVQPGSRRATIFLSSGDRGPFPWRFADRDGDPESGRSGASKSRI